MGSEPDAVGLEQVLHGIEVIDVWLCLRVLLLGLCLGVLLLGLCLLFWHLSILEVNIHTRSCEQVLHGAKVLRRGDRLRILCVISLLLVGLKSVDWLLVDDRALVLPTHILRVGGEHVLHRIEVLHMAAQDIHWVRNCVFGGRTRLFIVKEI